MVDERLRGDALARTGHRNFLGFGLASFANMAFLPRGNHQVERIQVYEQTTMASEADGD